MPFPIALTLVEPRLKFRNMPLSLEKVFEGVVTRVMHRQGIQSVLTLLILRQIK